MKKSPIFCAACEASDCEIALIGGLRRTTCPHCGHSQRVDIEPFDYYSFAMGSTSVDRERLKAQAGFVSSHLSENARALEVGCAAGDLAHELRLQLNFGCYHGVEISPARRRAAEKLDRVFAETLDELLETGAVQSADYDIVLSSHYLEHVEHPFAAIELMTRVMKPNGLLFVETPNRSGHAGLPFDDNRAHIHFFCVASLTRILARCGLETIALETGARHDARYPDCLRVMARLNTVSQKQTTSILTSAVELDGVDKLVVWGAGRMVDEVLAHYLDPSRIAFFVDRDIRKHGDTCMGAPVRSPDALEQSSGWCVLINSLEMETSIREEISKRFGARVSRVISVAELLDSLVEPRKNGARLSNSELESARFAPTAP